MKIFKSIKWRLQLWYGLILVVVLAGFGFTAYQLERGRLFSRIDDELQLRVGVLKNALQRPPPPHGQNAGHPPFDEPPRGQNLDEPPLDGPPPDQFPDVGPPEQNLRRPIKFNLMRAEEHFFDPSDPHSFYFIINSREGKELARSTNAPRASLTIADSRGIFQRLPSGEKICVGCSVAPESRELNVTKIKLSGIGGVIFIFGLAGGWWIVSRSLRPVVEISSAAVKISAGDLSQRINVAEAESELGQLAAVLNSTFARLEAAFAQQQQFTSDAAHELRTPVSVILTQTQTVLSREREAADYRQTVEACQRAAQRMRKLIESLLALAQFDAGQEILNRRRFDFSKTVSDSVELVQTLADERGVKIISEVGPLEITGDPELLAQVVTNLLTNAIQYNKPDGEVRVKLESQNGLAVLTVADMGQGIAIEDLPRVFGRFFRADESRTGAGNAGLGLAISKAIVEAHGGTLEVVSEKNAGTIFTVRLPI